MGIYDSLFDNNISSSDDKMFSVTTGIVKENWNEDHPGMLKIEYLIGEAGKNLTGWVPVMSPYAGNGFGIYHLPEVNSEVVVAFNMGDRNCPVVIGCLWNNTNKLPEETANEKNFVKRLKTKGGCQIVFSEDEGKEKITVTTPGKLSIEIEDEKKTIKVGDEKGDNGFIIDAQNGTFTINAKTKIELKVGGNAMATFDGNSKTATVKAGTVSIEGEQTLKMKGQSTELSGATINVKAQGSLKAEASGVAEIKGTMVKIN